jgi:hypothetical protein
VAQAQLTATSTFGTLIGDIVGNVALMQSGQRVIGDLYPHIVMEEVHEDKLQITQHPIETGTPVTDHAFPLPYTVEIRCGWSNSTAATEGFVQAVYQQLLALQAARQPFSIRTGKRQYSSMLMASVAIKTDADTEFALMVDILAQQIVITNTQTVAASTAPMSNGSASIGSAGVTNPGVVGTAIDGGADPAPSAAVTPDSTGAITWPNDPAQSGTLYLTPNTSAPSWADLAARLGLN